MQALIVDDDLAEVDRLRTHLSHRGFLVSTASDPQDACIRARASVVDLLVLRQVIGGRHTTSVALAAELRNPRLATILLSEKDRQETLELFEGIPSLAAVLGTHPNVQLLGAIGVASVEGARTQVLILSPQARVDEARPRDLGSGFASRRCAA